MKKIKILQIGGNLNVNGISSFLLTAYREMYLDFEFVFINFLEKQGYYEDVVKYLGGRVINIYQKKYSIRKQSQMIREIIRNEKPDVVHSHYYSSNGWYLREAYKERVPVRISHSHQYKATEKFIKRNIKRIYSLRLVRKYATVKLGCSELANSFLHGKQGSALYNAIDYNKYYKIENKEAIYQKYNLDEKTHYGIFIGRFSEQKNIFFLLDLLQKVEGWNLVLVGYGPLEAMSKSKIHTLGLSSRVHFLPFDSSINELLNISSFCVCPSLYEGFSIVLLEAQAVGIPCLATEHCPNDVQMGLVQFLPLEKNTWALAIRQLINEPLSQSPKYNIQFDVLFLARSLSNYYRNITGDEWCAFAKEFELGSKSFFRDKKAAFECYNKAYLLDSVEANFKVALAYFEGSGVPQDLVRARKIVATVSKKINRLVRSSNEYYSILADMYSFGLGKKKSFSKAFDYYMRAALQGNAYAMCNLGYMYLVGQGVEKDERESATWWEKAALLGDLHSIRDIGISYLHGYGVKINYEKACSFFRAASDLNYSHATADLAHCYLHGLGVEKNMDRAIELYCLSLKQDEERGIRDLIEKNINVKKMKENKQLEYYEEKTINDINENNYNNQTVILNKDIENINHDALYSQDIRKYFVVKENLFFSFDLGVLYNKDKTVLIKYPSVRSGNFFEIPSGVKVIGDYAFQNSRKLKAIIINQGLECIGISSFDDCKNLQKIKIPMTVQKIGDWAFHGCDAIKKIKLSRHVSSLGNYAFGSCESLLAIKVHKDNSFYSSVNGHLFNKEKSVFLQYATGKKSKKCTLPVTVKEIAFRAFSDAFFLREVHCLGVEYVGEKAFYYATSLDKVLYTKKPTTTGVSAYLHTGKNFQIEVLT